MVKRPEIGTTSRRYINSIRYKKKTKEKEVSEINCEGQSIKASIKKRINEKNKELSEIDQNIAIIEKYLKIQQDC